MLPDSVYSYNRSVHHSIKTKPADVTLENEKRVWRTLYGSNRQTLLNYGPKSEIFCFTKTRQEK